MKIAKYISQYTGQSYLSEKRKNIFISYKPEYISNIILPLIDMSIGERTPV